MEHNMPPWFGKIKSESLQTKLREYAKCQEIASIHAQEMFEQAALELDLAEEECKRLMNHHLKANKRLADDSRIVANENIKLKADVERLRDVRNKYMSIARAYYNSPEHGKYCGCHSCNDFRKMVGWCACGEELIDGVCPLDGGE